MQGLSSGVQRIGYLFERFPSFGQNFAYREVAELMRQGVDLRIFSIRRPGDEPTEAWSAWVVGAVTYLPEEAELVAEIDRTRDLPSEAKQALKDWGRKTDFLRLYQACWIGLRLRELGVTRVHAHFAGMAARTAWWLRRFFGIDYSVTAHANDIFAPRDFEIGLASIFDDAVAVVTVSDFAVEEMKERFPKNAAKFHRVYNGIDAETFAASDLRDETPLIISVGRLIEKKGFADLIAACRLLKARRRSFRCEILGEGPLDDELRRQTSAAKLDDVICFLGPQTQAQIAQHLARASVFALACKRAPEGDTDNLPTVIMEAMAAGLPIVSTRIAGVPEMVGSGENGLLVEAGDVEALADALEELLTDLTRGRKMGARGRAIAQEKFSIEANVTELRRLLGDVSA